MAKIMKGWNSEKKIVSKAELDEENHWLLGFFWTDMENEGREWRRDFHEIRQRDMMLFNLGEVEGKKILDVGCGSAEYLRTVAKMGADYLGGQDLSEKAITKGRLKFSEENIQGKLVLGDAVKLDFPDNFFDTVFSTDFFEHISTEVKEKVISEVYRVLKPGGKFVIKTPNLSYLKIAIYLKRILNLVRLRSPFIYITDTKDNPGREHHGLTTYSELENLLENNFFHTPEITYVPLIREKLPKFVTNFLYGKKIFTEVIIITAKKAIFKGIWG